MGNGLELHAVTARQTGHHLEPRVRQLRCARRLESRELTGTRRDQRLPGLTLDLDRVGSTELDAQGGERLRRRRRVRRRGDR